MSNSLAKGSVTIEGDYVSAVSPEGAKGKMKVVDVFSATDCAETVARDVVNPNGCRKIKPLGPLLVLVHETPPRVFNFKWITKGSKASFGRGTKYRDVRIGLPYVVVMAVFQCNQSGNVQLTTANECFFSNHPLESMHQPLYFPALLNCSRFDPPEGHPLSWICVQHIAESVALQRSETRSANDQVRSGLKVLLHTLYETGFNYSSDHHETNSWYSESTRIDKRIASVEAWEKATAKDKLFVLDLPWLKTNLTADQIIQRIFKNHGLANGHKLESAEDIARVVFNHKSVLRKP